MHRVRSFSPWPAFRPARHRRRCRIVLRPSCDVCIAAAPDLPHGRRRRSPRQRSRTRPRVHAPSPASWRPPSCCRSRSFGRPLGRTARPRRSRRRPGGARPPRTGRDGTRGARPRDGRPDFRLQFRYGGKLYGGPLAAAKAREARDDTATLAALMDWRACCRPRRRRGRRGRGRSLPPRAAGRRAARAAGARLARCPGGRLLADAPAAPGGARAPDRGGDRRLRRRRRVRGGSAPPGRPHGRRDEAHRHRRGGGRRHAAGGGRCPARPAPRPRRLRADPLPILGRPIAPSEAPGLWRLVEGLAERMGALRPEAVVVG